MDVIRHVGMTRAMLRSLPVWQRDFLKPEAERLCEIYCLYPDIWRWQKNRETHDNALKYGSVADVFEAYCAVGNPENSREIPDFYRHYFQKITAAVRKKDVAAAAKYIGSFSHYVADMCALAHGRKTVDGGQVFNDVYDTLLFPPPEESPHAFLSFHLLLESENLWPVGRFPKRKPRFLGQNPAEVVFHILPVHQAMEDRLRRGYYPAVLAFYRGNLNRVNRLRDAAYIPGIKILTDFVHTAFCVAADRPEAPVLDQGVVLLSDFPPLDFQRDFVNHLYRGQVLRNYSVAGISPGGWRKKPLALLAEGKEVEFRKGFGVGPNNWFTYYAGGIFATLSFLVGNHPVLGRESCLRFKVEGDGKVIFDSGVMKGAEPAKIACLDVRKIRLLKFRTLPVLERTGEGNETAKDHGVWANVAFRKD